MADNQISRPIRALPLPVVKDRTGMSRSTIYEMMASGDFPRPIKIGSRKNGWLEHEIDGFIRERVASRDGVTAARPRGIRRRAPVGCRTPVGCSNDKLEEVLRLARQGLSYSKISDALGISRSYCARMATEHGITRGGQYNPGVAWTDEQRTALAGMFRANLSASVMAKRFGVTHAAVVRELHRLGLKRMSGQSVVSVDGKRRGFGQRPR